MKTYLALKMARNALSLAESECGSRAYEREQEAINIIDEVLEEHYKEKLIEERMQYKNKLLDSNKEEFCSHGTPFRYFCEKCEL